MLVRKNYYLYEENDKMQQGKKKLLGSVRLMRNEERWTMEIQWKNENEAEALIMKAEEGELQLQIREKEIILGQERKKREFSQKKQENDERIDKEQQPTEEPEEHNVEVAEEDTENVPENTTDTNADKIEEQELSVTATENIREENRQGKEQQRVVRQSRTAGDDMCSQKDQEWELVRRSCHKVEACRELGEVYRVNKGDFAVLPESIKHILQNSFLVHGLMNYGYLLLFRADEERKQVGVGVPGVYYEKEKLVAEMFGFPQFWCNGRSSNGKFGYYLRIMS